MFINIRKCQSMFKKTIFYFWGQFGDNFAVKMCIFKDFLGISGNLNLPVCIVITILYKVAKGGIEPPTQGFSVLRSTN